MSPVVLAPVSTAYCSLSLAPPPDSVRNHPVIVRLLVVLAATFESVSKLWVAADPRVVRLTHWAPAGRSGSRDRASRARMNEIRRARSIRVPSGLEHRPRGRPGSHSRRRGSLTGEAANWVTRW